MSAGGINNIEYEAKAQEQLTPEQQTLSEAWEQGYEEGMSSTFEERMEKAAIRYAPDPQGREGHYIVIPPEIPYSEHVLVAKVELSVRFNPQGLYYEMGFPNIKIDSDAGIADRIIPVSQDPRAAWCAFNLSSLLAEHGIPAPEIFSNVVDMTAELTLAERGAAGQESKRHMTNNAAGRQTGLGQAAQSESIETAKTDGYLAGFAKTEAERIIQATPAEKPAKKSGETIIARPQKPYYQRVSVDGNVLSLGFDEIGVRYEIGLPQTGDSSYELVSLSRDPRAAKLLFTYASLLTERGVETSRISSIVSHLADKLPR